MAVDVLQIKSAIPDDIYTAFSAMDANQQKNFLDELNENELLNISLRRSGEFDLPETDLTNIITSLQRDVMSGGTTVYDPAGISMQKIQGSETQEFANEIFSGLREQTFDYSGLPNNKLRRGLSFMDTAGEKENYLTQNVGPQGVGWTMDKYGRYAIMPEFREQLGGTPGDMPLTIDNPGTFERGDIADFAGSAPEITATILASIATRNLGLAPAVLASGTAAGAAKTIEEGVETLAGLQDQTLSEVGKDVAFETALGATAELGGRAIVGAGKSIFSPAEKRIPTGDLGLLNFKTYTYAPRVDAASGPGVRDTYTLVKELVDEGALPDVAKATGRPILGRFSGLVESVFGYNQQKNVTNVKYLQDKVNGFLKEVDAKPFDPFMSKVFPKLGEEELGALIQFQRNKTQSDVELGVNASLKTLKDAIKTESDSLTSKVGTGQIPENVGSTLATSVNKAYGEFQDSVALLYNEADQLLGNRAVIPTAPIKREAKSILDRLPKTGTGEPIAGVSEITVRMLEDISNMPANINATHMQALRTMFGDAGFSEEMLKGFGQKQFNMLKTATNESFDAALKNGVKGVKNIDSNGNIVFSERTMSAQEIEKTKAGLLKLKEATSSYGEGIAAFDTRLVNKLTKRDSVDPDQLINTVVVRNSPNKINQFLKATDNTDEARKVLQSGHFDSMLGNATDVEGNFSASSVLKQIKALGTSFPALYGNSAPTIIRSLEQLNAAQKFIPKEDAVRIRTSLLDSFNSGKTGDFTNLIKEYTKNVDEQFKFLDANFNKQIGNFSPEEVIPWLTNKATSQDITGFINYYSKEAPEIVEQFRQKYMVNLLDNVYDTTKLDPVGVILNGENLLKAIQKEGVPARINAALGSETAQALERFAEKAAFITTGSGSFSGGLVAAQIALNPLQNVSTLIRLNILGRVLASPTGLRYLTTIIENPNARATGYAAGQLGADIIAQITAEDSTVNPDQLEKMTLELKNSLLGLSDEGYNDYEDEE